MFFRKRGGNYAPPTPYRRGTGLDTLILIIYLVFGLYFINYPFNDKLLRLPSSFIIIDKWIILVAGILLVLSVINYFRLTRLKKILQGY